VIKQITLPTTTSQLTAADPAIANAQRKEYQQIAAQAEYDLDVALNEGFKIVAQFDLKTSQSTSVVFILHKPRRGEREV